MKVWADPLRNAEDWDELFRKPSAMPQPESIQPSGLSAFLAAQSPPERCLPGTAQEPAKLSFTEIGHEYHHAKLLTFR